MYTVGYTQPHVVKPSQTKLASAKREHNRGLDALDELSGTRISTNRIPRIMKKDAPLSLSRRWRKDAFLRPPSTDECIADQYNYAAVKGCLCYLFQSTGLSDGSFESSQAELDGGLPSACLIYTFVGDVNEIVRVEITGFVVGGSAVTDQKCENLLRIFTRLDRAELSQDDQVDFTLSGHLQEGQQNVFYSTGRVLVIELQSTRHTACVNELRGTFRFENKDVYQHDGVPIPGTVCDLIFVSPRQHPEIKRLSKLGDIRNFNPLESGKFFSYQYPQNYPPNISCTYYFIGHQSERLILSFYDVRLYGSSLCSTSPPSDEVTVIDSSLKLEKLLIDHLGKPVAYGRTMRSLCGEISSSQTVSEYSNVIVRFQSQANSRGAQGFKGHFRFTARDYVLPTFPQGGSNLDSRQQELASAQSEESYEAEENQIVRHIRWEKEKSSGVIESPNYPHPYPNDIQILYIFHIPPKHRVRINFFDFHLDDQDSKNCLHSDVDRLEIYDGPFTGARPNLVICGTELPNELFYKYTASGDLISTGQTFCLRFVTDSSRTTNERGFVLSYLYESTDSLLWSEGSQSISRNATTMGDNSSIYESQQHQLAKDINQKVECQFTINGDDVQGMGKIPFSQYLRMITNISSVDKGAARSDCRWKLQGKPGQRIQLKLVKRQHNRMPMGSPDGPRELSGAIQHDEQDGPTNILSQKDHPSRTPLSSSLLDSLRCKTPISIELVNYRPRFLESTESLSLQDQSTYHDSFQGLEDTSVEDNPLSPHLQMHSNRVQSNFSPSDPIRLCAADVAVNSPAIRGFMSGQVPRLDVILRLNNQPSPGQPVITPTKQLSSYLDLGYDIEFKFVTDYGVIAPFGYQRRPGCFFEFNRSQSLKGNFSSPNYPGLYPIDLLCEYRFTGSHIKKIEINFLEFDVEGGSKTCSDDRMGDYVELRSCYPMKLLSYRKRRLCNQQDAQNHHKIEWHEPCLLMRFYSNDKFVRNGFFGVYEFYTSGLGPTSAKWHLLSSILIHFGLYIVQ
ncbi:unnamed protein product [Calicophoron daubneyi]|uniref:CUB domain-containing protein n=1 Tax=Calicophoron daubneyi TaxID=300641 RepID=A0AAV2TNR9_CALDB